MNKSMIAFPSEREQPKIARMRFAHQCIEELRKIDPDTPIKECFIRSLVKRGLIPSVPVGRRRLVNFDALLEYLSLSTTPQEPEIQNGIRKIPERF